MKNPNKASAQKYLRRRDSLESPQFSTVIEVNPSCQSQQSMLQKIIFPGRGETKNINNCDSKVYKTNALLERNPNVYQFRKNRVLNEKDQNILKHYESQQCSYQNKKSPFHSQRQIQQHNFDYKPKNMGSKNYNYERQPQLYQSLQQNFYSTSSQIDQQKLQKIQQKIRNHQMRHNNKQNQKNYETNRRSRHDTMQKQLSKIQIYDSQIKMRKKPTIIDKIKDQKVQFTKKQINYQTTKTFDCQPQIDRFTKNSKKCLQTIYDLILINPSSKLSPSNINLKNSIKQEIKLVFGPIFADVTIKGKSISKKQFVDKANQILSTYRDQEIEDIFFSIVNGLSKNSKDNQTLCRIQQTKSVELARVPGKLLKNSKTGCETKQKQKNQEFTKKQKQYFSNFQISQNFTSRRPADYQIPQRVSKKVYIQQTEKTQPQQNYQTSRQKITQRYDTKVNLNHQTLEIMLNQERSKKKYSTLEKKNIYESKLSKDDDQLERLNNLQKRFYEHFKSKKAL